MIKIYQHGSYYGRIYEGFRIVCQRCGCVFEADTKDLYVTDANQYSIDCPECDVEIIENKEWKRMWTEYEG